VAGEEAVGAEPLGEVDHRRQPHLAVAEDAGVGGLPPRSRDEAVDDAAAEFLLEVEGEVRDAERVATARAPSTASGRAAGLGPSVSGSAQSLTVIATTSAPRSRSSRAATALSTPPDMATATRSDAGASEAGEGQVDAATEPRALWSASAARTAA
jgi:hypothetical protein